MTELQVERYWPYVASIAVTIFWIGALNGAFPQDFTALMGASGTVAAVLMGFIATSKAIVFGLTGSPVFQSLKRAGYHQDLLSYLMSGVFGSAGLLVVSLIGFFIEPTQNDGIKKWAIDIFPSAWILVASFAFFSFIRLTRIFFKMIGKV